MHLQISVALSVLVLSIQSEGTIATNISYEGSALLISDRNKVCVVKFETPFYERAPGTNIIKDGVRYKFRVYDRKSDKEAKGDGSVYEHYQRIEGDKKNEKTILNLGRVDFVVLESMNVTWSVHTRGSGWIYFDPSKSSVQIVGARYFEKIDLSKVR